jgi:mono/diheme cytochrome c family protein
MSRHLISITALFTLAAGCDSAASDADCEAAADRVEACYGAEVAEQFAATCDAEAAPELIGAALSEPCDADGKADGFGGTPIHPDGEEHFKYGSIGADWMGLPKSMYRALPLVCEDRWRALTALPASADPINQPYAGFGAHYEPGRELPIGISTRRLPLLGTELVAPTCALCHNATVREAPSSSPVLYLAAPNAQFDIESYNRFFLGCIQSREFSTSNLRRAFRRLGESSWLLPLLAPFVQRFVAPMQDQFDSLVFDGPWGPGRDDAIGLTAAFLLDDLSTEVAAPVDYPSAWNQAARRGGRLHWDGAAGSALERNVLVAIGAGTPEHKVPFASIDAIQRWLDALPPPAYPYAVDADLAARGEPIFERECASCHSPGGDRFGDVVPLAEIGTDPNRVLVIDDAGVAELNSLRGPGWELGGFEKTGGYVNSMLDGIWLRAPYLHNGSVPTLRDLLSPARDRPRAFYRGYNVYDQIDLGYVSDVAPRSNAPSYGLFDTALGGNDNGGHEYGTDLPDADKDALLEYLKTL